MAVEGESMTTVVLGLDGAAFELVRPWLDAGELPAFQRLMEEGAAADMRCCPPPVTCPNWQVYATGTNPGKLGVFWWEQVNYKRHRIEQTSASGDFDGTYFWHYLDGKAAVINLPTSYPPPSIDGIHIAGGPGADQSGFTVPISLENELEKEYGYVVHPTHLDDLAADAPESPCVDEIYELIEQRFDVLEEYMAKDDFAFVHCTIFYLNVLQHYYWDHDVVKEAWKRIDHRLGTLMASDDLETLFVMSDHGTNKVETTFYINRWLEQMGYLRTSSGAKDLLHQIGITRDRIRALVSTLGIGWWLRKVLPRKIQMMIPDQEGGVKELGKEAVVDWDESVALASGQGPLYVLTSDPEERARLVAELRKRLAGLELDGRRILTDATPATEIYEGLHLDIAPDLVLRQAPGVHIEGAIGGEVTFESPSRWSGENQETGLFAAYGPGIDSEATLPDMHILDIAPTVLHHLREPVPTDMDGSVRTDAYKPDAEPSRRAVASQQPMKYRHNRGAVDTGRTRERLSNLGYLQNP